jgi:hypothetical protein
MSSRAEVHVNDVVRLKKKHPCGGHEWTVVRVGADIGLTCLTCGRRVLLRRREFNRRLKKVISRGWQGPAESPEGSVPPKEG